MSGTLPRSLLTSNQVIRANIRQRSDLLLISLRSQKKTMKEPTWDSKREQSIQTPSPVCDREIKAAIIAPCTYNPVVRSIIHS